jgi:predicted neutral ceramidase superfamily lipid hydrolase
MKVKNPPFLAYICLPLFVAIYWIYRLIAWICGEKEPLGW